MAGRRANDDERTLTQLRAAAALAVRAALPTATAAGVDDGTLRWAVARRVVAAAADAIRGPGSRSSPPPMLTDDVVDDPARACALASIDRVEPLPLPAISWRWLGAAYPQLLAPVGRKHAGAWFTTPALAEPTVERTLAPFAATTIRIVDPAVGAGAFLLAALQTRVAQGHPAAGVAATELFGFDCDPTAAQLAALTVHEACGHDAPPLAAIAAHIRCGDGLVDGAAGTFDAVLGNPPWETLQTAGRESPTTAQALSMTARVQDLRQRFRLQGRGKLYTYRLFVERALQLLRDSGRLGLLVPSGLWSDRDARPLRDVLLRDCDWEWLFGLENRHHLFDIDSRYRFGSIIARKGGATVAVRTAFLRRDAAEWQMASPPHTLYPATDVAGLSPHSRTFVEVRSSRDLALLRKLGRSSRPLLGPGGLCQWRQGDFNMTAHRHRFLLRAECEASGYTARPDGTWRRAAADPVLRPLWQGGMIDTLDANAGAFVGGTGRAVRWRPPQRRDRAEPQYLLAAAAAPTTAPARIAIRALTNATNARSAICCLLADEPCGNSLGVLTVRDDKTPITAAAFVTGVLASLVWDWALRQRLSGTNVNGFVLADMMLPAATAADRQTIATAALNLGAGLPWHEGLRAAAGREGLVVAASTDRPLALAQLELTVADAFGLDRADLEWILRDCSHDGDALADRRFTSTLDPKGFWRVDRALPPAARLPARILGMVRAATATAANQPQLAASVVRVPCIDRTQ